MSYQRDVKWYSYCYQELENQMEEGGREGGEGRERGEGEREERGEGER